MRTLEIVVAGSDEMRSDRNTQVGYLNFCLEGGAGMSRMKVVKTFEHTIITYNLTPICLSSEVDINSRYNISRDVSDHTYPWKVAGRRVDQWGDWNAHTFTRELRLR